MELKPTYGNIFKIAMPIILFQLAQNVIGFTDTIFLGRVGELEMGAVVLFSVFYLVMQMIGYGISRGGQILIARRAGENKFKEIGQIVDNLFVVQMVIGLLLFLFLKFGLEYFLPWFIHTPEVYEAGLDYLGYRAYGLPFSFFAFVFLSLYTGIGQTRIITVITVMLAGVNIILDYVLIFGAFGAPVMGIGGAGLASAIAEIVSGLFGIGYVIFDKKLIPFEIFRFRDVSTKFMKKLMEISTPIALQYIIGLGGWFIFFTFIENMGQRALAISGILKQLYTFYSIPAWGLGTAANSIVSNLLGMNSVRGAIDSIKRTTVLSIGMTAALMLTIFFVPDWMISIFRNEPELIDATMKVVYILAPILFACAVSSILFNAVMGTGATRKSLVIEIVSVILYLAYAFVIVNVFGKGLTWVWMSEFVYWFTLAIGAYMYLRKAKWWRIKV